MHNRLFHALSVYDTVGLFVEFKDIGFECNPGDILISHRRCDHVTHTNLSIFENLLASFTKWGIETRMMPFGYVQAPYSMLSLIRHMSKKCHTGVRIKYNTPDSIYKNMLIQMDGIGPKTANKIVGVYGTMESLVLASTSDLVKLLGPKTGKYVYDVLREKK